MRQPAAASFVRHVHDMRLEIHPGAGIGRVRLGMSPAEVEAVFTEPHKYEEWMGGNLNDALLFHGLIFTFDVCDGRGPLPHARLNLIEVRGRADVDLLGQPLHGWTADDIGRRLREQGHAVTTDRHSVRIPGKLELSFDGDGRLDQATISGSRQDWQQRRSDAGIQMFIRRPLGLGR